MVCVTTPAFALPDLEPTSAALLSTHAHQTRPLGLSLRIRNNTSDPAGAFEVAVRVSTTTPVTSADRLLARVTLPGIGGNATEAFGRTLTVPVDLPPGNYSVGFFVNDSQAVAESNVLNNALFSARELAVGGAHYERSVVAAPVYQSIAFAPNVEDILRYAPAGSPNGFIFPMGPFLYQRSLPFPFRFFDQPVSDFSIGTDGWLSFRDRVLLPARADLSLSSPVPDSSTPDPGASILPFWTETFLFGEGSERGIFSLVTGSPGSRVVTYELVGLESQQLQSSRLGVQIRLHEATGRIEIQYQGPTVTDPFQRRIVTGIQDFDSKEVHHGLDAEGRPTELPAATLVYDPVVFPGQELELVSMALLPERVPAGATTGVDLTVANLGDSATPDVSIGIYEALPSGQRGAFLGSRIIPSLAAGERRRVAVIATAPVGASGPLEVLAVVDDLAQIAETVTVNNSRTRTLTVAPAPARPDLVALTPSLSSTSIPMGGTFTLDRLVRNTGSLPASGVSVRVLVSEDSVFDECDGTAALETGLDFPAGGLATPQPLSATLPSGLTPGSWLLSVYADSADTLIEVDEANNFSPPIPIQITPAVGPELMPISLTLIPPVPSSSSVPISMEVAVQNFGDAPAPAGFRIGFGIGTRNNLVPLTPGPPETQPLAPGAVRHATLSIQTSGSPVLLVGTVLDAPAGDRSDNNVMGAGTNRMTPVAVSYPTSPPSVAELLPVGFSRVTRRVLAPGSHLTIHGPPVLNGHRTSYDEGRILFGAESNIAGRRFIPSVGIPLETFRLPAIPAHGVSPAFTRTVTLDRSLRLGTHRLLPMVAALADHPEADTTNNFGSRFATQITIAEPPDGTDLLVTAVSTDLANVAPGGTVQVTHSLENARANPARPFVGGIYLALDGQLDAGDQLLEPLSFLEGLLGGGFTEAVSSTVTIPTAISGGPALIGVVLDTTDNVAEDDETNNARVVTIMISGPRSCDLNGDGQLNVSDVQRSINVALGLAAGSGREDVNGDGQTNVSDVQSLINGALGGSCP